MLSHQEIISVATDPDSDIKWGCDAQFVRLNKTWGLKWYRNQQSRDNTYAMQQIAHAHGFGPAVGQKIEFETKDYDGDTYMAYGYLTECAVETVQQYVDSLYLFDEKAGYRAYRAFDAKIYYLVQAVYDTFGGLIEAHDTQQFNCGLTADGDVIFIDFGDWYVTHSGGCHTVTEIENLPEILKYEHAIHLHTLDS